MKFAGRGFSQHPDLPKNAVQESPISTIKQYTLLFHDVLLCSYLLHCVYSGITDHIPL